MNKTRFAIAAAVMLIMISSVSASAETDNNLTTKRITGNTAKVGIMPFMAGKFHANIDDIVEKTISCTIGQLCFEPQDIQAGAEEKLTRYVRNFLELHLDPGTLIPLDQTKSAYGKLYADENKDTIRSLAVRFGKLTNADYVLVGTVWRYRDRSQKKDAFERSASVGFVAYLVDVTNGKRIWKGFYNESQGALTEDISNAPLFFKGGAQWLTANEIAKIAVKEAFEDFPFDEFEGAVLKSKTVP